MKTGLYISFLFFLLVLFFVSWSYLLKPCYFVPETVLVVIEKGESVKKIGQKLEQKGVVCSSFVFESVVWARAFYKKDYLRAGGYRFYKGENIWEVVEKIAQGREVKVKVLIREGETLDEIEKSIEKSFRKAGLEKQIILSDFKIKDFVQDFPWLQQAPQENSLEGFLFPDTYYFSFSQEAREIAFQMLRNFEKKVLPLWQREKKNTSLSFYETVILASILEKEVKTLEDKKKVSSILQKRLQKGWLLQVDSTLNYVLKKKVPYLTLQETKMENPYNTYKYPGLPPTPISNPGLESFEAALSPVPTPFWFYLTDKEGKTYFSRTYKEHLEKKYRLLR